MVGSVCRYLRRPDNPEVTPTYPALGNRCCWTSKPSQVANGHQAAYCLHSSHPSCPIYTRYQADPDFRVILEHKIQPSGQLRIVAPIVAIVTQAVFMLIFAAFYGLGYVRISFSPKYTQTPTSPPAFVVNPHSHTSTPPPTLTMTFTLQVTGKRVHSQASKTAQKTSAHTPIPSQTSILSASSSNCGVPSNWLPYRVKKGDTLFGLSRFFKVSIVKLQSANCMANSTLLRSGSTLYIPRDPSIVTTPTAVPSLAPTGLRPTSLHLPPTLTTPD